MTGKKVAATTPSLSRAKKRAELLNAERHSQSETNTPTDRPKL
jgi:hypothetical protein